MDIVKYVNQDGTGDYTDIFVAFNDMLSSGVAATGEILTYLMIVDDGTYTGSFSGYIPHSGRFHIHSSGAIVTLDDTSMVSGVYSTPSVENLLLENMLFDCSSLSGAAFEVVSGFGLSLKGVEFIDCGNGINNSNGAVILNSVSSHGSGVGTFLNGSGYTFVTDSMISNYGTGIYSNNLSLSSSTIFNSDKNISAMSAHNTSVYKSLIYGGDIGINALSGILLVDQSTIANVVPIHSTDGYLYITNTIMSGEIVCISGMYASGSFVQNSCTHPSGWIADPALNSSGKVITSDPKFNNSDFGDYRLKMGVATGSPCIEFINNPDYSDSVSISVNEAQFKIYDEKGASRTHEFLAFIHRHNNTIRFTDYNNETYFAQVAEKRKKFGYQQIANFIFSEYSVPTSAAFSSIVSESDAFPWDWDWRTFTSVRTEDQSYLIPRSIVNIEDIARTHIGDTITNVLWSVIAKKHITVYDQINYRGISFDPQQSDVGISVMWLLDGRNQTLIKQNAFSGEEIEKHPLLCAPLEKSHARPSGLVFVGAEGDMYRFVHEQNPDLEILAPNLINQPNGSYAADVPWIPTHLNQLVDMRGVLAYKDHVFITSSRYAEPISDRFVVPTGFAQGILYWYPNNDLFYNYTRRPEDEEGPSSSILNSGNMHPTDITVYEDGIFLVTDAYKSEIYRYKPAYDYALIENSYDNETRVILREYYQDVDI